MLNKKLKMSLIGDYIKILKMDIALKNSNFHTLNIYEKNNKLKNCYEYLLFKFGLMDVSLLVLKKEIDDCSNKIQIDIEEIKKNQQEILFLILDKIKKLKLNAIETKFVTKKLM